MKNLNICIDIDGTITEPYYWLDYANKYFNLNVTSDQIIKYDIAKCLNVKREDYNSFYQEQKFLIHNNEKIRNDVKPILDVLYQSNNLYYVTARDKSLELLTNQYIIKHNIPYDDIFVLGSYNKVPIAEKLNCHIFIEDSYENALLLAKNNFNVLLLDTNYNKFPLNNKITRVYNWNQILEFILNYSKEEEVI